MLYWPTSGHGSRRLPSFGDRQFLPALGSFGELAGSEAPDNYFLLVEETRILCATPEETDPHRCGPRTPRPDHVRNNSKFHGQLI
jgi:hypothetical protein